jgi:UDP-N-acetylmuramate dehydrogenase
MRVGGPADLFVVAHTSQELELAVAAAGRAGIPLRVIGSGANILVADAGVRGLVVRNVSRQFVMEVDAQSVTVDAGMAWPVLARRTAKAGLQGLEWGCGVPGTVGGTITNNAGCYGSCTADALVSVDTISLAGTRRAHRANTLPFAYRSSPFKARADGTAGLAEYVLRATFQLRVGVPDQLLHQVTEWLAHRAATQPLALPSAGSFFKNPPGDFAGRLIEFVGMKGHRIGGAATSEKHANFLVNRGGASAHDVYQLAVRIREEVYRHTGTWLEREVEIVGAWEPSVFNTERTTPHSAAGWGNAATATAVVPAHRLARDGRHAPE